MSIVAVSWVRNQALAAAVVERVLANRTLGIERVTVYARGPKKSSVVRRTYYLTASGRVAIGVVDAVSTCFEVAAVGHIANFHEVGT